VFLDFIGITLLSPGLRFMIDPAHPQAFDDLRAAAHCLHNQTTPAAGCDDDPKVLQPGTAISIMMFAYGIGQLLSTALMGVASDRFGPRKVLIFSTAGTALAFALQGCVWQFWPHALARFIGGLFGGSRPVCAAYIAATVAPHERPKMLGYMALCATQRTIQTQSERKPSRGRKSSDYSPR
jgi:MFS family permease